MFTLVFRNCFRQSQDSIEETVNTSSGWTHMALDQFNAIYLNSEKRYACTQCSKSYARVVRLREHMTNEHDFKLPFLGVTKPVSLPSKPLTRSFCSFCDKSYSRSQKLREHIAKYHSTNSSPRITVNEVVTHTEPVIEYWPEDLEENSGNEPALSCTTCKDPFTNTGELKLHIKTEHSSEVVQETDESGEGRRRFHASDRFVKFRQQFINEDERFQCALCNKSYTRTVKLRDHMLKIHAVILPLIYERRKREYSSDRLQCPCCEKSYTRLTRLRCHMTQEHGVEAKDRKKEDYIVQAVKNSELDAGSETGRQLFTCEECGKSFNNRKYLTKHRKKHEYGEDSGSHLLDISVPFVQENGIKRRFYTCTVCSIQFSRTNRLREHMASAHKTMLPFKSLGRAISPSAWSPPKHECERCNKSFSTSQHLRRHLRIVHQMQSAAPPPVQESVDEAATSYGDMEVVVMGNDDGEMVGEDQVVVESFEMEDM